MTRTAQFDTPFRRSTLCAALAATLLTAALPAAHADVLDFEGYANVQLGHNQELAYGNFLLSGYSNDVDAQDGDAAGVVVEGADPGVCVNLACPTNGSGDYYAGLNDSALFMSNAHAGQGLRVSGFDASFIGSVAGATYPALAGFLRVQGFYAGGGSFYEDYLFPGGANGFGFQHFTASAAFAGKEFAQVAFFGFNCGATGACSAFNSNKGQFALDNVIASVPEPSSALMLLLGLGGLAAFARRRRA